MAKTALDSSNTCCFHFGLVLYTLGWICLSSARRLAAVFLLCAPPPCGSTRMSTMSPPPSLSAPRTCVHPVRN
ncbi:hypothetical protein XELAEV_18009231mg [Xenopus laevis]|uniref:Uncharacterized protein n=1 Tax=Xenopus laevis TaxID=8355 RepID=A0A974DU21_XENLA|nr:hypothetical protein XELAEV_18009231mg [Xenopus laevis]